MESQLGVALVGPTSCTSCLWFFLCASSLSKLESVHCKVRSVEIKSKHLSRSGVKLLSQAVQISARTTAQSNMRTLANGRSRGRNYEQTNRTHHALGWGSLVHLELARSLHTWSYLSFLESKALSDSFSPSWLCESDVPFLLLNPFCQSCACHCPAFQCCCGTGICITKAGSDPYIVEMLTGYCEESAIPIKIVPGKVETRTTRRITI